jgi:hypothetical protein
MEGHWGKGFTGEKMNYYINGTIAITYWEGDVAFTASTLIISYKGVQAYIFYGIYTREEAVSMYRIGNAAETQEAGYRAILAYMKMQGINDVRTG